MLRARLVGGLIVCAVIVLVSATAAIAAPPVVTTTTDSATPGSGSLREAIAGAAAGDTVVVPASATPYTVTLGEIPIGQPITIEGAGASSTVIDAGSLSRAFHITGVSSTDTVTFKDLTIKGGMTTAAPGGGGIDDESGALALDGVTMTANTANFTASSSSQGGGAINMTGGDVTVTDSILSNNAVTVAAAEFDDMGGAAIHVGDISTGTITISGSTVSGNHGTVTGSHCCNGGAIYQDSGEPIVISNSTLDNNTISVPSDDDCCNGGGAVYQDSSNDLTITSSTLSGNTATVTDTHCCDGGGAIYADTGSSDLETLTGDTLSNNTTTVTSGDCCSGGGASSGFASLAVSDTTFTGNTATITDANCCDGGGALLVDNTGGHESFTDTEMSHNTASVHTLTAGMVGCCNGGGALNTEIGQTTVSSSDFSDNQAMVDSLVDSGGGGVYSDDHGSFTVTNSTISDNTTNGTAGGGGIYFENSGSATPERFSFDTLANNAAPSGAGGGIFSEALNVDLNGSVVALNSAHAEANCGGSGTPVFTSSGYNLEDTPGTCSFTQTTDKVVPAAQITLGPLAENGGPTMTRALLAGDPGIDAVPSSACTDQATPTPNPITVDQRGITRPQPAGGNCDIGAFETGDADIKLTETGSGATVPVGGHSTLAYNIANRGPLPATGVKLVVSLPAGVSLVSGTASLTACTASGSAVTCPVGFVPAGESVTAATLVLEGTAPGTKTVTATATEDELDPTPSDHTATASLTVLSPTLTRAKQSHKTWRDGSKLASITSKTKTKKKPPVGTKFVFVLNEAATVKVAFTQTSHGRKAKGGHCNKLTKKNRSAKKCTITKTAGTLTLSGSAGTDAVFFQGKLTKSKKLKPGRYTAVLTASAGGVTSKPAKLSFTIAKS